MSNRKRKEPTGTGRGGAGKAAVVGVKDRRTKKVRAEVAESTDGVTLQGVVTSNTVADTTVYTDEATAYSGLPRNHETVRHSVSEYARGMAHAQGIESFWSMLKRGIVGTHHHLSEKQLQRYVNEFAGRQRRRELNTLAQMQMLAAGLIGGRLLHSQLTA